MPPLDLPMCPISFKQQMTENVCTEESAKVLVMFLFIRLHFTFMNFKVRPLGKKKKKKKKLK